MKDKKIIYHWLLSVYGEDISVVIPISKGIKISFGDLKFRITVKDFS